MHCLRASLPGLSAVVLSLSIVACGGSKGDGLPHAGVCSQTFTACGGDPTGTWDIVSVCSDVDLKSVIGGNGTPACDHMTSHADLVSSGSLTFGDGWVERDTYTEISFTTSYTPACVAARDAGVLDATVCAGIEADILAHLENGKGTCTYDGTNCNCDIHGSSAQNERHAFSAQDTWIEEDGNGYQICVDGSTMAQSEEFFGGSHILTVLKKRL